MLEKKKLHYNTDRIIVMTDKKHTPENLLPTDYKRQQ